MAIFQPNNHSKWGVTYHPVSGRLFEHLSGVFRAHYGMKDDQIVSIGQVCETEVNSNNFRICFSRDGNEYTILLRRYDCNKNGELLEDTAGVLIFLHQEGLKVPEIILSHGGRVFEIKDDHSYIAYKFISGDHFRGTLPEIATIGFEMGKLDNVLATLPNKDAMMKKFVFSESTQELRSYSIAIWEDIFQRAEHGLANSQDREFDCHLLSKRDVILNSIRQNPSSYANDFAKQIVHFDIHPHNLITDGTSLLAIIDFDSLRTSERIRAVAFALHRIVRQHVVYVNPGNISSAVREASETFFDAYCIKSALAPSELRAIPYFIRAEAIARLSYSMKENYLFQNSSWKGDFDKQISNILESDYFSF